MENGRDPVAQLPVFPVLVFASLSVRAPGVVAAARLGRARGWRRLDQRKDHAVSFGRPGCSSLPDVGHMQQQEQKQQQRSTLNHQSPRQSIVHPGVACPVNAVRPCFGYTKCGDFM
jgi:hypothetical protein